MDIPRRFKLDQSTPTELAIRETIHAVEALGADVRLTRAVAFLGRALNQVSDYVDDITAPDPYDAAADREAALTASAAAWEADALRYCQNADHWQAEAARLTAELDALRSPS